MAETQGLFDALSGAFGHPVNRAGLNAYVANGQALNGLRSAQTDEAMQNAQRMRDEADASDQLEQAYQATGMRPVDAHAAATISKAKYGNAQQAMDALLASQKLQNTQTLSDPTKLNSPEQTAAQQGIQGKVAEPVTAPSQYVTLPGMAPPNVQQTPLAAAETSEHGANALLHTQQALHPEKFHGALGGTDLTPEQASDIAEFIRLNPASAANIRALLMKGGAAVAHQLITAVGGAQPGAVPAAPGAVPAAPGAAPAAPAAPAVPVAHTPPNGITPAPGVSLNEQAAIRKAFASGPESRNVGALDTMAQHAVLFDAIADQMKNGNFVPTNWIKQHWMQTFGSAVPGNLKLAGDFLGREAIRATVNSGAGTGEERQLAVNGASAPEALHGAADTLRLLAGGQLRSLGRRAARGGVDITQMLGPESRAAFSFDHNPVPGAGGPPAGGPMQIASDADYAALPSGAEFIAPDGSHRRKP
jgi:hypothetical protein